MVYPTKAELFALIASTTFSPFTKSDWDAFAGCESENPMIGASGMFTIVLDGSMVNIIHEEDGYGGQLFELNQLA